MSWSELSCEPVTLRFSRISVTRGIASPTSTHAEDHLDSTLSILDDVSGTVRPGEVLGILGGSGSGKTTLLNFLAGRLSPALDASGTITFNHRAVAPVDRKHECAYVMQHDHLLYYLSVRETLEYAARFRLPSSLTDSDINSRINAVLRELGLIDVADVRVGDATHHGISGGEKRRLSTAIQLLTSPGVLFADEVTTGLDSAMAQNMMETLKKVAEHGRVVICTLHAPRSSILELCDSILLLSSGRVVYYGSANGLVDHFASLGFPFPLYCNPADIALDLIMIDRRSPELEKHTSARVKFLVQNYYESHLHQRAIQESSSDVSHAEPVPLEPRFPSSSDESNEMSAVVQSERFSSPMYLNVTPSLRAQRAPFIRAISLLVHRLWKGVLRDFVALSQRVVALVFFGFLIFLFIYRLPNDQTGVQSRIGFLYESFAGPAFIGILNAVTLFATERDMFYRERMDSMYTVSSFLVAYTLHSVPIDFIASFAYGSLLFYGVGMSGSTSEFFIFVFIVFFIVFAGESVGMLMMSLVYDVSIANNVANLIFTCLILTVGFLRTAGTLPVFLKVINYISAPAYAGHVIAFNELNSVSFSCATFERLPNGECPFSSGRQLLIRLGLPDDFIIERFIICIALSLVYRVGVYFALRYKRQHLEA